MDDATQDWLDEEGIGTIERYTRRFTLPRNTPHAARAEIERQAFWKVFFATVVVGEASLLFAALAF